MEKRVKCAKCGSRNLPGAKYCSNCGEKFVASAPIQAFDGLGSLFVIHLTGSLYLFTSLVFNSVIRTSILLTTLYLAGSILGLVSAWGFHGWSDRRSRWIKVVSVASIAFGFSGTLLLFLIGLDLSGVVGPGWLIFLLNAWQLWKMMRHRTSSPAS